MRRYFRTITVILALAVWVGGLASLVYFVFSPLISQKPITVDNRGLAEKSVVDYLYGYLIGKAGQLETPKAEAEKIIIGNRFNNAVMDANRAYLREADVRYLIASRKVHIDYASKTSLGIADKYGPLGMDIYAASFTRLARYLGEEGYQVTIGDLEWRVNMKTKEVKPWNEEATELLQDVTHNTYHNALYGYHIDYPVGWQVVNPSDLLAGYLPADYLEGKVAIGSPESPVGMILDKPRALPPGQSFQEFVFLLTDLVSRFGSTNITSVTKLANGDYRLDYEWTPAGTKIFSRVYYVLHNGQVYSILGQIIDSTYEPYRTEFDYAYRSFGFR